MQQLYSMSHLLVHFFVHVNHCVCMVSIKDAPVFLYSTGTCSPQQMLWKHDSSPALMELIKSASRTLSHLIYSMFHFIRIMLSI